MKQYNIDIDHVIRHFDVNGKHCPSYFMNELEWKKFRARILGYMIGHTYQTITSCYLHPSPCASNNKVLYEEVTGSILKKCKKSGLYTKFKGSFKLVDVKVVGNDIWGQIKSGYWVPLKYKGLSRAKRI